MKKDISRRDFLKLSAASSLSLALSACKLGKTANQNADIVFTNGRILTMDRDDTVTQALAVKTGKLLFIGTNNQVQSVIGPDTTEIDLHGATVTPGLIDSHIHIVQYGKQNWAGFTDIRFPNVTSKDDLLRIVVEAVARTEEGGWIAGNQGFLLPLAESPDRYELDAISPNNPVYLKHVTGQFAVVNSYALHLAGIGPDTPNPPGGMIIRNPDTGEPTGILHHYSAQNLVGILAPGWGERSDADLMDDVRRGQEDALAVGYTSGQDVIVSSSRDVQAYRDVWQAGDLKMRMYLMQYVGSAKHAKEELKAARPFNSNMCTFGGWKLAMDGGASAGTSLMYDTSLPMSHLSHPYYEQEVLNLMVTVMHQEGYQVSMHCAGDRGIDMAINAIEAALIAKPDSDHRHKIEHALFPTSDALQRIKDLGIVISTQPNWISMLADGFNNVSTEEIMSRFMPLRTMQEMGIPLAFGCDVPATPFIEPNWTLAGATTRTTWLGNTYNPEQKLSMYDTIRIHTMGSAYASFEENVKGSLEPGKNADMVVWSQNPLDIKTAADLANLKPVKTIVGGKIAYEMDEMLQAEITPAS